MPLAKRQSSYKKTTNLPTTPSENLKKLKSKSSPRKQMEQKFGETQLTLISPSSPSSSTSTRSSSSECHQWAMEEHENEKRDFLESLYDTDSETELEEDFEYQQSHTSETAVDFFGELGHLPEIDAISEDINVEANTTKQWPDETLNKDVGQFVDPLTGDVLCSKSTSETELPQSLPLAETIQPLEEQFSEKISEMSEIDPDLNLSEEVFEDDVDLNRITDSQDLFENFLEMEAKKEVALSDDIDWEAVAKEEEVKQLRQYTMDLVNDLIRIVVETVTNISPDLILRHNLDKRKLMLEIRKKGQEFEVEHRTRLFLNQKVVEFFRRKKSFRAIMPDSVKTLQLEMKKHSYAVSHLDQMLARKANVSAWTLTARERLENELKEAEAKTQAEIQQFEDMVKKNLMRDSRPKCNVLIVKLLSDMSKCRQEVNKIRFELLIHQHTKATLMEKLTQLEDLGNGLTMKNFGSLQTETQALDHKIEERNVQLNKLHTRVRNDIHVMAHYRERQKMLRNSIMVQRMALEELTDEKQMWRKKIFQLKLERNRLRQQMNELSFKGGLLDKPALMFDYDHTCEMVKKRRDIVCCLRETQQGLQRKLETMTKRCLAKRLSII